MQPIIPSVHVVGIAGSLRTHSFNRGLLRAAQGVASAGMQITVGLDLEDQHLLVLVRDQGPGLPLEEQERIWERFQRVQGIAVQSGTGVGLGLGLYICRTIIERHQGQMGVESAPGQGSTFWFTIPLGSQ